MAILDRRGDLRGYAHAVIVRCYLGPPRVRIVGTLQAEVPEWSGRSIRWMTAGCFSPRGAVGRRNVRS